MGADQSQIKGAANNDQFKSFSNFSPGYILKLKERFELQSDDFTMDKQALKQHFKCSDRECNIIFDHFDMDGNGKIDSYEFVCALTMMSHATLDEKAELLFSLYDFDGSKYISRDELVILMTNALSSLKSMQKLAPPTIQEIEKKTDEFFSKADVDQDKKITIKEFKAYITQDKQILEILLNANVAKKEDLGMDFGAGQSLAPAVDPDLENECCPKDLIKSEKKQNIKDGIDIKLKQNTNGDFFEEQDIGEGDQFMAVKPWLGVVNNSQPSKFKPSKRDGEAPDATLKLDHIYGYRCHDARNNLRYTASGQIVYHAAAVGIVLDQKTNTQKFFMEHNDDIHCLAIDPSGKFCATGQIGPKPFIFIWNNETMECIARIQGTLLKGVKTICFSQDGKYLAASAFDEDHTIAVYDWQTKPKAGAAFAPIASGKGTRANILSMGFNPQGNMLIATAVKEVNFFTFDGGLVKGKKGTGWNANAPQEGILCQGFVDDVLFTGSFNGNIIQWNGTTVGKPIKAHTDGCQAMISRKKEKGLISGGGDGIIIVWGMVNGALTQQKTYDLKMPEIKSMLPKARSVCEHPVSGNLLVGTRGGEILEFTPSQGAAQTKPLIHMRAHFEGELWGLATHPTKEEFITIGQDNMLAIWDIKTKKQKQFGKLDCAGNVLAYTHDETKLAIGYTNGTVQILMLDASFSVHAIRKDRKEAISEIKFSPNDSICAVGAHDSMIFTYDAKNNFKPLRKMRGHPSTISHFDFSLDGNTLMSNCTSYNILFFDVVQGKHNPSGASGNRDEVWQTWTCTLGWPVQGIFPPCADGSDINSCDRAPDGTVIATADDFGMVKLFRYPNPVEKAASNQYVGHSSHVTNVRFTKKSQYLISTGGEDKCIFQWKYFLDKESAAESLKNSKAVVDVSNIEADFTSNDDMFQEQEMGEGDQKLAVEPFKGEVMNSVPSGFKLTKDAGDKPDGNLKLKYAHGFRSFDTRQNLKYLSQNEIVFSTAALGVVLNKPANKQRFFNLHEEDIVSLAIHPNKDIIATGQMAAKGKAKMIDIFIWKASTLECLAQLNKFHLRAVRNLKFSPSGDKLVSVGEDDFHSVAVWDWANKRMISSAKVDPDKVFDVCWKDETEFATVGMKHVKFFTLAGTNLTPNKGLYGTVGPTATISSAFVFDSKTFVSGTPQGNLLVFGGRTVSKAVKGHTDALWAIQTVQNDSVMITGGNDAKIIFWDKTFTPGKVIDLSGMSKFQAGIRSMDFFEATQSIIVGTRGSEIIEIDKNGQKVKTLVYGHFEGTKQAELWGCCTHPKEQIFASCGADSTIRTWKPTEMLAVSDQFKVDLTAIDWSQNAQFIVVGDRAGFIHTVDPTTLKQLASLKSTLSDEVKQLSWVEDVKISPNSQMIAFGTHGGLSRIELVKVIDNGKKIQKIAAVNVAISSALTHLDWSTDSNSLVINSQAAELMWLDANSQQRIFASGAKDIDWFSWTSIFGFPVQGIWPGVDFTDVNSVCRSTNRRILATADDFGKVKLFKYPCVVERAASNQYMGHSSHVTKVKFSFQDQYVVSTGGNDKTVLVWETDFGMGGQGNQAEMEQQLKAQAEVDYGDDDEYAEMKVDKAKIQKQQAKEESKKQKAPVEEVDDFFDVQDVGQGTEFMAVKPWEGQIREPTGWNKPMVNQKQAPKINMEIEWVHGYRSRDSRNNIGILADGSIAYHAAALGIVYNPADHTQRFFNAHIDDVTAIAFSPDKRLVATGEIGPKPMICIWDAITMQIKHKLQGKLTKGIQALSFSPSGKSLAGVGIDEDHSVAVYNVDSGACIGFEKGDKAWIIDICMKDDLTFSTSGVKHFMSWTVGANLTSKRGVFGQKDMRHGVCKYMADNCLTGSITGEVYVWQGNTLSKGVKVHDKPVDAITVVGSQYVLTGAKDNKVNVLAHGTLALLYSFTIDEVAWNSCCGKVRALAINNNTLFVGTLGSEIYQVDINVQAKTVGQPKILVNGHYSPSTKDNNEVWGLCVIPGKDMYVSVSDDATLRVWDVKTRKQLRWIALDTDAQGAKVPLDPATQELANPTKARCCDCSNDGKFVALGFKDGSFRIYETTNWKMVAKKKASEKLVQDIKFSPNNKQLAVAAHDFKVHIYTLPKLEKTATCNKSTAGVTHLDWSLDSQSLHTNDLSYEVLYFRADSGQQDPSGASNYRDEQWATWTLPLGWPVQGIWQAYEDGSDINAVDRSAKPHPDGYYLVASANDSSLVKVFRYPSTDRAECFEGRGHSSHVTNVKFNKDDKYLFSAGGNDTCIIQWKITI